MGRIRTIKPEFWKHEGLSALSEAAHLLAAALLNYADDEGYFNANAALIKAECFPLRELSRPVPVALRELSSEGYIRLGAASNGRQYGFIVNFRDHQTINKFRPSKIKDLDIDWSDYGSATVGLPEDSRTPTVGNGMEWNREQGTGNGMELTTAASAARRQPTVPTEFDALRHAYPKRAGSQPWNRALKAASARLKEGSTWDEMLDGTRRYAEFCRVTGKVGTEHVLQAATFLGPDRHYREAWTPPAGKGDQRMARSIAAAMDFITDGATADGTR